MGCKLAKPRMDAVSQYADAYTGAAGYVPAAVADSSDGLWVCVCGFKNKPQNEVCGGTGPMGCKSPKPMQRTARAAVGGRPTYQPGRVTYQPAAPVRQVHALAAMSVAQAAPTGDWVCAECGFKNKANNTQCGGTGPLGCNAPYQPPARASRGVQRQQAPAGTRAFSAPPARRQRDNGDKWVCTACGFKNNDRNTVCGGEKGTLGCKAPREDSGGEVTETIQQLDDEKWSCPECGFTNKPMNEVCGGKGPLGCKAPKPMMEEAEVEEEDAQE